MHVDTKYVDNEYVLDEDDCFFYLFVNSKCFYDVWNDRLDVLTQFTVQAIDQTRKKFVTRTITFFFT